MIRREIPFGLIRRLLYQRIAAQFNGATAQQRKSVAANLDALTDAQLTSTPEATLVVIVQSLIELRRAGATAEEAIEAVNAFRQASQPGPGRPPGRADVPTFIAYRVLVEHGRSIPGINGEWLGNCYFAALAHLECTQDELER